MERSRTAVQRSPSGVEPSVQARVEAISDLTGLSDDDAIPALSWALADGDARVRLRVLDALGRRGGRAVPLIGQVMYSDADTNIRLRAVELLAAEGGPASLALLRSATRDHDAQVRTRARALLASPNLAGVDQSTDVQDSPDRLAHPADAGVDGTLLAGLVSADPRQRSQAIRQLSHSYPEGAAGILGDILASDPDQRVRLDALLALGNMTGEDADATLLKGLGDAEAAVRYQTLETLDGRGGVPVHVLGQVLITDDDPRLRLQAVALLAEEGGAASLVFLRHAANDVDPEVSRSAQSLLYASRMGEGTQFTNELSPLQASRSEVDEGAESILLEQLVDPDPGIRINAIQTMANTYQEGAVPILGDILVNDPDADVRQQSVAALDSISGDAVVAAISMGMGDDDASVRQQVLNALWNQGGHTNYLIGQTLFSDPDPAIRYHAVELLAADATPAAMALIQAATEDADAEVRYVARQAMQVQSERSGPTR